MKLKIKLFPAIMTLLSAVYFVYVFTSADTRLTADAVGGDPGGKVLPMFMAVFMFLGFLYITIRERPDGKKTNPVTMRLFLITLGLAIAYVLLIRKIGFIILTTVLLFSLEYIFTTVESEEKPSRCIARGGTGGLVTLVLSVGIFFVMRKITKALLSLGRSGVLPNIFTSIVFEGVISLIFVALCITIITLVSKKIKPLQSVENCYAVKAGIVTLAVVLGLYVIFKQFFSVNLAPGITNF